MKLEIKSRHVKLSPKLLERIYKKASFAFSRSQHLVNSLIVTLSDDNDSKGGKDKRCKVVVHSHGLPTVIVDDVQPKTQSAVDSAIARAGRRLQQSLKRRQKQLQNGVYGNSFATQG